jgi:hypothetical protein
MTYLRGNSNWSDYAVTCDGKVIGSWIAVDTLRGIVVALSADNHLFIVKGKTRVRRIAECDSTSSSPEEDRKKG